MKRSRIALILLPLLTFAALLAGCSASGSQTNGASLVLRTYTVPEGDADTITVTLDHALLLAEDKRIGRAYVSGPRQILVMAPDYLQHSIADSIRQIVAHSDLAVTAKPLRLDAWVVDVNPGKGPADPRLKSIQTALRTFEEDSGPTHFALSHHFVAVSDVGIPTQMQPLPEYMLNYTVTENQRGLSLQFRYNQFIPGPPKGFGHLVGRVTTRLGQALVLGMIAESPAGGEANAVKSTRDNARRAGLRYGLLVIRTEPAAQG